MYHNLFRHVNTNVWKRSIIKSIDYESIDFNFKPNNFYIVRRILPTKYKIPNVPYLIVSASNFSTCFGLANLSNNSLPHFLPIR